MRSFALNESAARKWLDAVVEINDAKDDEEGDALESIRSDWNPTVMDEEVTIEELIENAQDGHVITSESDIRIDFVHTNPSGDDDSKMFAFDVILFQHNHPDLTIKGARWNYKWIRPEALGGTGVVAAFEILRRAVIEANTILATLDALTASK